MPSTKCVPGFQSLKIALIFGFAPRLTWPGFQKKTNFFWKFVKKWKFGKCWLTSTSRVCQKNCGAPYTSGGNTDILDMTRMTSMPDIFVHLTTTWTYHRISTPLPIMFPFCANIFNFEDDYQRATISKTNGEYDPWNKRLLLICMVSFCISRQLIDISSAKSNSKFLRWLTLEIYPYFLNSSRRDCNGCVANVAENSWLSWHVCSPLTKVHVNTSQDSFYQTRKVFSNQTIFTCYFPMWRWCRK